MTLTTTEPRHGADGHAIKQDDEVERIKNTEAPALFSLPDRSVIGKYTPMDTKAHDATNDCPKNRDGVEMASMMFVGKKDRSMLTRLYKTKVTGATGGMGLSVTGAILQSGADVIAIDRGQVPTTPAWVQLQDEATKRHRTLTYYPCDISDLEATTSVFRNAVAASRFPLRGLVNCAGIGWLGDTIDFPLDDARRILDVNLVGTLVCAQAGAKLVREHGLSASFVFIASMSGYVVNKGAPNAVYAASKAGVQQLARNLAAEWGSAKEGEAPAAPIRINTVSPGVIRTPMTAGILGDKRLDDMWTDMSMLKRLAEPEDFRGPIVFLLSDASGYVTGTDLLVDAGYTSW